MLIRPISKIAFKRSLVTCVGAESEQTHEHDLSLYNEHTRVNEWRDTSMNNWNNDKKAKSINRYGNR